MKKWNRLKKIGMCDKELVKKQDKMMLEMEKKGGEVNE